MTSDRNDQRSAHAGIAPLPRVAIVGGGLAGLAAAVGLAGQGFEIDLFEARRSLGGRATSFRDPASGAAVDHCQHVSLGCCTNLADFCRRTGIQHLFRRDRVLHFFDARGGRHDFAATRWLPAPLHLAPALLRMRYLSLGERLSVGRAMLRLARTRPAEPGEREPTVGEWLAENRQSDHAIEQFWSPVLVSALGETVDNAALSAARKVFVDGFMSHRAAYEVEVPTVPLGELYGQRLLTWLGERGARVHLGSPVNQVEGETTDGQRRASGLILAGGERRAFDYVVLAVTWRRAWETLSPVLQNALPKLSSAETIRSAPITGVHLWFDRAITPLPHAVLLGTLGQWLFNRSEMPASRSTTSSAPGKASGSYYYQVVISASRSLAGKDRAETVRQIQAELAMAFPAARDAQLLKSQIVTEQAAVFSVAPGLDAIRPGQQTAVTNLMLAGDWTATGWPATMEGAVRSGYLAAAGRPERLLAPDLPRGLLARWLIR